MHKRNFKPLEMRRVKGAKRLLCGVSKSEVARQLGVAQQMVASWSKRLLIRAIDTDWPLIIDANALTWIAAAPELVNQLHSHVVLKGVGSICITRECKWHINTSGNPGLASGGMGDALAGMIAALMAQGLSAEHAMLYGVYLHGAAADRCVANGVGPIGLTASEVIDSARSVINKWVYQ